MPPTCGPILGPAFDDLCLLLLGTTPQGNAFLRPTQVSSCLTTYASHCFTQSSNHILASFSLCHVDWASNSILASDTGHAARCLLDLEFIFEAHTACIQTLTPPLTLETLIQRPKKHTISPT